MHKKAKSPLRIARVALAIVSVLMMTLLFASGAGQGMFAFLAKAQFIPSLLAANFVVLAVLLLLTFLFGRLYCTVICPLGITQDFLNWLTVRFGGKKKAIRFGYSRPHNVLRYVILALYAVAVIFGIGSFIALMDPYAAFGRIMTDVFGPVSVWINNLLASVFSSAFVTEKFIGINALALSVAIVTFVVVAFLAVRSGRTYCNTICPVGSLLGIISRYSLFRIHIDEDKCSGCGLCGKKCRASCIDTKNHRIDYSRCVDCMDCIDNCSQGAISFGRTKTDKTMKQESEAEDTSRRKFLSALAMVSVTGSKLWAQEKMDKVEELVEGRPSVKHSPVSPFGSISHEHLNSKCSACHLCIDKCPNKVLRPALKEYGLNGMMQPVMDYTRGFCDYECNLCSQVCPAGAIKPLTVDEKQSVRVGLAVFNRDLCVVNKGALTCNLCASECPAGAVKLIPDYNEPLTPEECDIVDAIPVEKRPHSHYKIYPQIEPELCIGCGACQYHCPGKAIIVEGFPVHR